VLKAIVAFLLKGPTEAIAWAILCSVVPFLSGLTHVIIALVTLRKGPQEGLFVLLWSALPSVVFTYTLSSQSGWYNLLGFYLLGYILATILYYSAQWSTLFNVLCLFGMLSVAGVHWLIPDIHRVWLNQFQQVLNTLQYRLNAIDSILCLLANIATGTQMVFLLLGNLWHLSIARGLQSMLFNPGAFRQELISIQLDPKVSMAMIISTLFAVQGFAVGLDMLPVIGLMGGLTGLSITAFIAYNAKFKRIGYVVLYSILIIFLPYAIGGLTLLAWVDSFINIRKNELYKN
jgi:hypothetical protein